VLFGRVAGLPRFIAIVEKSKIDNPILNTFAAEWRIHHVLPFKGLVGMVNLPCHVNFSRLKVHTDPPVFFPVEAGLFF
jgi:hypothetical protein